MNELDKINDDIKELDLKIVDTKTELDKLTKQRSDLIKSVRSKIKAELQIQADKYGFVIRNKTSKSKKKSTEEENTN